MQQELITIAVITIVYTQLSEQWHDVEWYVVTHQEVLCVRLSYDTEPPTRSFSGFSQSCQAKTSHDLFLAHTFQVTIL